MGVGATLITETWTVLLSSAVSGDWALLSERLHPPATMQKMIKKIKAENIPDMFRMFVPHFFLRP
jgi:hypothetical protein